MIDLIDASQMIRLLLCLRGSEGSDLGLGWCARVRCCWKKSVWEWAGIKNLRSRDRDGDGRRTGNYLVECVLHLLASASCTARRKVKRKEIRQTGCRENGIEIEKEEKIVCLAGCGGR